MGAADAEILIPYIKRNEVFKLISSVLWDISLGIISGVISSVIVSKVFLIYGDNQKQLEILETNINKIDFIHGELSAMKKVTEVFHDQEIDMRSRANPYEGASDEEILSSQEMTDDLQKKILAMLKKDIDKINVELNHIFCVNQEARVVINSYSDYIRGIKKMKACTFAAYNEIDELWNRADRQFEKYARSNKKRLIKQILTDRFLIILCIIILLIIVT